MFYADIKLITKNKKEGKSMNIPNLYSQIFRTIVQIVS